MTQRHRREEGENSHIKKISQKTLQEAMSSSPELCKELTAKLVIATMGADEQRKSKAANWLAENFFTHGKSADIGYAELGCGIRALVFTTKEMQHWQIAAYVPIGAIAIQTSKGIAYLSIN